MPDLLVQSTAPLQPGISTIPNKQGAGGSAIATPHPDYTARRPDWVTMFDTNEGQRHIKSKNTLYLPATSGMRALSSTRTKLDQEGLSLYTAYLTRAFFPDLVKETVRALAGILDREAANIELPDALEDMREIATPKGESLNDLLIQMHMLQLLYGRMGILADVDADRDLPLLIAYPAPQLLNWDDHTTSRDTKQQDDGKRNEALRKLLLTVIDESRFERDTGDRFTWNLVPRFRALSLGTGETSIYTTQVERDGTLQDAITPNIRGTTLDFIPLVFCNTTDTAVKPGEVPLVNLANLALAIYRGEADHRSALFMSGQDTLVITGYDIGNAESDNPGADAAPIIGAGAYLNLPDKDARAEFIGPESEALAEQRTSLENDYTRAGEEGIKLLSSGSSAESTETLRIRVAARTATLQTIAMTAATALEASLRHCAVWVGANPEEVKVEPNLDFIDESTDPTDLIKFAQAKKAGIPLSAKSIHNWMRMKDFTEFTFDEELQELADEEDNELLNPPALDLALGVDENGQPLPPAGPGNLPGQEDEEDDNAGNEA